MTFDKCKSCGGDLERIGNYYVCKYCGNKWMIDADNDVHVIDRANAWSALRDCDFERATELFENIIYKEPENHEAYWGRALASAGIMYVTDLNEHKKVPTCNSISEESFISSSDVQKAISLAPNDISDTYQVQAEQIENIRSEWVKKASKEPPYDIFICYKDSDRDHGIERTDDSYDAHELYNVLTAEGYKVFFSRVSLKSKVSEHYEPYIYNAIKTAKVMIVFGEKPEYFNAVWVKNEWMRFRKRIELGEKHPNSLVVVYKNMAPADLPVGLRSRQCLDTTEITFLDDLKKHMAGLRMSKQKDADENLTDRVKPIKINPLHEHAYTDEVVPASCVARGYTVHRCACGYEYKDNYTNLAEHKYAHKTTKEPTCTASGYTEEVCSVCGDKKVNSIPAKGHTFGKWIEKTPPTCTVAGKKIKQCSECGYIEEETLPAKGHQWSQTEQRTDEHGNKEYVSFCKLCGEEKISKESEEDRKAKEANKQVRKNKLMDALGSGAMTIIFLAVSIFIFVNGEKIGTGIFCDILAFLCGGASISFAKEYCKLRPILSEEEKAVKKKKIGKILLFVIPSLLILLGLILFVPTIGRDTYSSKAEMISQLQGWWASEDSTTIYRITPNGEIYWSDKAKLLEDEVKFNYLTGTLVIGYNKFEIKDGTLRGENTVYRKTNIKDLPTKEISDGTYIYKMNDNATLSLIDTVYGKKFEGELIIPSSFDGLDIVSIGSNALEFTDITSVTIPGTIKSIGSCAFSCCFDLKTVVIQEGVTSMGINVFLHCSNITSITIPKSMQELSSTDIGGMWLRTINYNGTKSEWETFYEKNKKGFSFDGYTVTVNCSNGTLTISD